MLQTVDGRRVYVVEFDTMPELPITWKDNQEALYAQALTDAIQNGVIKEPGKYGITLDNPVDQTVTLSYSIYTIKE
jgi:hypothetical protein